MMNEYLLLHGPKPQNLLKPGLEGEFARLWIHGTSRFYSVDILVMPKS